jgi:hypothetical protein
MNRQGNERIESSLLCGGPVGQDSQNIRTRHIELLHARCKAYRKQYTLAGWLLSVKLEM